MPVEKVGATSSLVDVLDRILDKGIVIDAWVRVSLIGIEILTIEARVVAASVETYLKYAEAVGLVASAPESGTAARVHAQMMADEAREAQHKLEDFIGLVSHELKTPLAGTQGSVQLAKRKLYRYESDPSQPEQQERNNQIIRSVLQALANAHDQTTVQTRLVNDLLDASRIHGQKLRLLQKPCELNQIVRQAVENLRTIAPNRVIELDEDEDKRLIVCVDADRIGQVIANYLSNALKYSPADRPVFVRLEQDGEKVKLLVRDEGPGLPAAEQKHIWTRFYRVSGIHSQQNSGVPHVSLGVGLHICKGIIEQHHGEVGVDSSLGEGSTFWFTLPLHAFLQPTVETAFPL
ncbi:sensor histidine kinase [Dictyobacter formicarum]|uniref:Gas vesicle protein A n=1 Tax=Dictyobacter formicarum TaxID=2778368 RepID=A0ABQ3VJG3_9CHLR|nr:HAMP domain-containing sensor histidine kinase [Dictyobacter formicarum]GHO85819.1 hypothetical protein KSZ_38250 [Dictyobacter formicarum]